jgi:hypothetical protein
VGGGDPQPRDEKVEEATGVTHRPLTVEQEEIGIVDQVPFASDTRLPRWKAEHAAKLNGYGWVDPRQGRRAHPDRARDGSCRGRHLAGGSAAMKRAMVFGAIMLWAAAARARRRRSPSRRAANSRWRRCRTSTSSSTWAIA